MKVEAINCPNCGAGIASDSTKCEFCRSRLKTMACPHCLGLLFVGAKHCSHCGEQTVATAAGDQPAGGLCPRCRNRLEPLTIGEVSLSECHKCSGLWMSIESFERLCHNREEQSAVLAYQRPGFEPPINTAKIRYVPCPVCSVLMNRSNFARASGVIIDTCREHGVWFDVDELPGIVSFIREGGMRIARERELREIAEQREKLREDARAGRLASRRIASDPSVESGDLSLKGFIRRFFDV